MTKRQRANRATIREAAEILDKPFRYLAYLVDKGAVPVVGRVATGRRRERLIDLEDMEAALQVAGTARRRDRLARARALVALRLPTREIAGRVGVTERTVQRWRREWEPCV